VDKGITIRIRNFEKYKGRSDVKHHLWFRCSNDLLEDEDFFDFEPAEILVWIYILGQASKKKSADLFINFERAERFARLKKKDVLSAIEKLSKKQLDRITEQDTATTCTQSVRDTDVTRTDHVQNPDATLHYTTLHYTNDTRDSGDSLPPLAVVWNENCGELAKVKKTNPSRNKRINARYKEHSHDEWVEIVKRVAKSDFCNNKAPNSKGWVATFDWLLQPEASLKIIEGKYDNRDSPTLTAAKDEWAENAQKVARAIKQFGEWGGKSEPEVRGLLGDELYQIAIKAGVYKIRQLPSGPFYLNNIVGMLKEAAGP
jgi:hypothetical protein